jgi:hypothetical protein
MFISSGEENYNTLAGIMTEEFFHHVWKFKLFDQFELYTTDNETVEIIKAGEHNFNAGPDFFNAKIKIGNTLWAGNVEVHVNSSDWKKHHHQKDRAYDNIILHIVNNADEILCRASGEKIPTIEIKNRIEEKLYHNYLNFKLANQWIPCEKQVGQVPSMILQGTIDKMAFERLEKKSDVILNSLHLNQNNWEETFYQLLARNFGFKTNAEPFELLAKSLPSKIFGKHKNSLLQIEALLFGQAGMLNKHFKEKYPRSLQNEYVFLKQKFKLASIDEHLWKFLRLRPLNFPSIRIAQFANLIYHSSHLFSKILETEDSKSMKKLLNISVSDYWETHYLFDKEAPLKTKHLGEESVNNIIINTIVPFLFVYGKHKANDLFINRAMKFLEETSAESNSIIDHWKSLGITVNNAHSSQAMLQLKNEYCSQKQCLKCNIGNYLIKNS